MQNSNDRSVWRDLFPVSGLGRAAVVPAVLSFSAGGVSDISWDIVGMTSMMSKQGMTSLAKCAALKERVGGWEWADMMLLYSRNAVEEDSEFARRMGVFLQEMEAAYNERVDFIKELEAVSGVDATVKTTEFLIDAMWKDERRLQRLRKLQMDAHIMAYEKEKFTEKL
ncbi:hypothetical protein Tco_0971953 [Tanacetum coccineum]